MSQGTLGMNPEQVRMLGNQLASGAGEIRGLVNSLSGQLENTYWIGPDRDSFQNDWQSAQAANLMQLAEALEGMSRRALANADQQEQASAPSGSVA